MVRRLRRWLPFVLVAACASTRARPAGERADWVLVRTPMTENLGIPIYAWERVRMFPSAEDCSIYRMELLENAVSRSSSCSRLARGSAPRPAGRSPAGPHSPLASARPRASRAENLGSRC